MNADHLHRLSSQPDTWNEWRRKHPQVRPDLSGTRLNSQASRSTLDSNKRIFRIFQERSFQNIDLHDADLRLSKIWSSDLSQADLRGADLSGAEIRRSCLKGADLQGANLRQAQFLICDLARVQFNGAVFDSTHLGFTKLGDTQGLHEVQHRTPSYIDQFTIINSMPLPASFLEACGVQPYILRMAELHAHSRLYHTCFISYSRRDEVFASYLREALSWEGVPSWFAPRDMRSRKFQGNDVELERDLYSYVDEAERVLLVISPNILPSKWVGKELQRARSFTEVIPILIDEMPAPDSPKWKALIGKTGKPGKYTQLNPESYSKN